MSLKDWIDIVIAIGALVVAALAFLYTHRQKGWQERHDQLSVRPFLTVTGDRNLCKTPIEVTEDGEQKTEIHYRFVFDVMVHNIGLGPALFRSLRVEHQGNETTLLNAMLSAIGDLAEGQAEGFGYGAGFGLAPGQQRRLAQIDVIAETKELADEILERLDTLVVRVEYESIYGEKLYHVEHSSQEMKNV